MKYVETNEAISGLRKAKRKIHFIIIIIITHAYKNDAVFMISPHLDIPHVRQNPVQTHRLPAQYDVVFTPSLLFCRFTYLFFPLPLSVPYKTMTYNCRSHLHLHFPQSPFPLPLLLSKSHLPTLSLYKIPILLHPLLSRSFCISLSMEEVVAADSLRYPFLDGNESKSCLGFMELLEVDRDFSSQFDVFETSSPSLSSSLISNPENLEIWNQWPTTPNYSSSISSTSSEIVNGELTEPNLEGGEEKQDRQPTVKTDKQ